LFGIGDAQLVEGDGAKAGIGYVRRNRRGAIGRADCAGDKTLAAVLALCAIGRFPRQARALGVEFIGDVRHAVVGLRDAGRRKSVGRDDVGAGAEISEVNGAHGVRTAEIEQVVVAAHFSVPGVETRAAIAFLV
jgi:hypothetical protein